MRRSALAVVIALALTAACGSSSGAGGGAASTGGATTTVVAVTADAAGLPAVTGSAGQKPTIATPTAAAPTKLVAAVLTPGTGAIVNRGDLLFVHYLGATWAGREFDNSFDRGEAFSFTVGDGEVIQGWDLGLLGKQVGSRVVLGIPSSLGYGSKGAGADIPPDSALVFVVDIVGAYARGAAASGTAQPLDDATLPKVTGEAGSLAIAVPGGAAPTALVARTLVLGAGKPVERGEQIVVQYVGALWDGGKVFDSSWQRGGKPVSFPIGVGKVIAGWDEALVGITAGSRVLLVIPSAKAYGDAGRPPTIPGGAALVFVVDVLGTV